MSRSMPDIGLFQIVSPEEWHEERIKLLADEKAHTKQADELAKRRQNLVSCELHPVPQMLS